MTAVRGKSQGNIGRGGVSGRGGGRGGRGGAPQVQPALTKKQRKKVRDRATAAAAANNR
jgi:hypothetical protein